jgi:oxygen-independent coproporphyrinogen III oxidase
VTAGIYIHIPFCKSRCSYCDFATDIYRNDAVVERYVDALCTEINGYTERLIESDTIYFGGGTPSLLRSDQLEQIVASVRTSFQISSDAEITMEMNPATVTPESLAAFRSSGVNRASFGVQTFDDDDLKLLARGHNADDARNTFRMLRGAGFTNVSFDLIAGLPGQDMGKWKRNLSEAINLSPEHMSLYLLEIHEGTPMAEQVRSGRRPSPDDDLAAEMYEYMVDTLEAAGYIQYEISNFSKPGYESRHNSKYWRLDPVYGFGLSAHSFDGVRRWSNTRKIGEYMQMLERSVSPVIDTTDLTQKQLSGEFAFLKLRLSEGLHLAEYQERFGSRLEDEYSEELAELKYSELIEVESGFLKLTRKGMLYSNEVFAVFV